MITGGNVTIVVSDMEASVRFYSEVLGLKLIKRTAHDWVTFEAGSGLTIGLTLASKHYPAPGTKGGMLVGLEVDEKMEDVVERLTAKGVRFTGPIVHDERAGVFANFEDPDGAQFYLWQSAWS